jgi:hypothetical protein
MQILQITTMSEHSTYMRSVAASLEPPTDPEPLTLTPKFKRTHTDGPGDPTPDSNSLLEGLLNFEDYMNSKRGKVSH